MIAEIARNVHAYDFFQALRLMQIHWRDHPRIGTAKSPDEEPVRFGQRPSLAFAPSTLEDFRLEPAAKLFVRGFGLFGPNGPLPFHVTDYAESRERGQRDTAFESVQRLGASADAPPNSELPSGRRDPTIAAFLDLFHHRFIALFFRAWACQQPTVDFDRPDGRRFPFYLGSFFGMANEVDEHGRFQPFPDVVDPEARLYHAGRLACPTRNTEGLEAILRTDFEVPVEVETFVGRWFELPAENRLRLGETRETGCLGETALLGARTWQCQQAYRVRFGPLCADDFRRLLPGGPVLLRLASWLRHYLGAEFYGEIQLVVRRNDVPDLHLDGRGRLGWDTWVKSRPFERDPDDVVFDLDRATEESAEETGAGRVQHPGFST